MQEEIYCRRETFNIFFRIYCLWSAAHSIVFNSHENWQLGKPKCWKLRKLPWEPSCPSLKNMSYPTVTSQAAECEPVAGGISESANVPSAKLKASIRKCSSSLEKWTRIALTKFWKNTRALASQLRQLSYYWNLAGDASAVGLKSSSANFMYFLKSSSSKLFGFIHFKT